MDINFNAILYANEPSNADKETAEGMKLKGYEMEINRPCVIPQGLFAQYYRHLPRRLNTKH